MLKPLRWPDSHLRRQTFAMAINRRAHRSRKTRPENRLPADDDEHARLLRVAALLAHPVQVTASDAAAAVPSFVFAPRNLIFKHVLRLHIQPVRSRIDPFDVPGLLGSATLP